MVIKEIKTKEEFLEVFGNGNKEKIIQDTVDQIMINEILRRNEPGFIRVIEDN